MINGESSLEHQLLHISVAEPVPQVPPDAEDDNLILEMSSSEQRRSLPTHLRSPYQRARTSLQQSPRKSIGSGKISSRADISTICPPRTPRSRGGSLRNLPTDRFADIVDVRGFSSARVLPRRSRASPISTKSPVVFAGDRLRGWRGCPAPRSVLPCGCEDYFESPFGGSGAAVAGT